MTLSVAAQARFWAKVDKSDGCWEWTASRHKFGYGYLNIDGESETAHRLSWQIHFGPIPEGLFVLHRCDNPPCVNLAHLFLGTHADNMADRNAKGRHSQGSRALPPREQESGMTEPTIWDNWAPPTTDNEWSREAAESVLGSAGTLRRLVAGTIKNYGPIAEWDLEEMLSRRGNTVRPRLWELQRHGIIELDPEPGVTPSGRKCGRYRITALGRKLLAL